MILRVALTSQLLNLQLTNRRNLPSIAGLRLPIPIKLFLFLEIPPAGRVEQLFGINDGKNSYETVRWSSDRTVTCDAFPVQRDS